MWKIDAKCCPIDMDVAHMNFEQLWFPSYDFYYSNSKMEQRTILEVQQPAGKLFTVDVCWEMESHNIFGGEWTQMGSLGPSG